MGIKCIVHVVSIREDRDLHVRTFARNRSRMCVRLLSISMAFIASRGVPRTQTVKVSDQPDPSRVRVLPPAFSDYISTKKSIRNSNRTLNIAVAFFSQLVLRLRCDFLNSITSAGPESNSENGQIPLDKKFQRRLRVSPS